MTAGKALDIVIAPLDRLEKRLLYRRIRNACGVTSQVIINWRAERTPIKPVYRDKINEIVGRDIFADAEKYEI